MTTEPQESVWLFPPASSADENGLVAVGADITPSTLLAAYRNGLFPMPLQEEGIIGWWSPDPRGVLRIDDLYISKSLEKSLKNFEIRVDTAFEEVIVSCANPNRSKGWIDSQIISAYIDLHNLGWAHSIEAWDEDGLAGGLYGVNVGGLFAGESMFHRKSNASKVALVGLVNLMDDGGSRLIDVQWLTDHLQTLGCSEIERELYLEEIKKLTVEISPNWDAE